VQTRDRLLLDAAIDVLGTRGLRQLTHRAVDAEAGLAEGSTSNRFRTREALLVGVLQRILEREMAIWAGVATEGTTMSIDGLAAVVGGMLKTLSNRERTLTQARRAVFVEAVNEPALRDEIARARAELQSWFAPLLTALGSDDPKRHVRYLLALMDGLVGNQLVSPARGFDPAAAVAALLRGLIER
jgi:AcrR family transcriptional regulator